jgi:hypothetical protein
MEQKSKYQNGKIYAIRSPHTDMFYIGSTCQKYLSSRLASHIHKKNSTSKIIIDFGNAFIELLENYSCNSRIELCKKENELIILHKNNIVNHNGYGSSIKDWRLNNKDKIKETYKKWYEKNQNILKQKRKEYYEKKKLIKIT